MQPASAVVVDFVQSASTVVVDFSAVSKYSGCWFQYSQKYMWSLILVRSASTVVVDFSAACEYMWSLILVQPDIPVVVNFSAVSEYTVVFGFQGSQQVQWSLIRRDQGSQRVL